MIKPSDFRDPVLPAAVSANAWSGEDVDGAVPAAKSWGLRGVLPGVVKTLLPQAEADPADFRDERVGWGLVLPDNPDIPPEARARADDAPEPIRELLESRRPAARVLRHNVNPNEAVLSLRDYAIDKPIQISGSRPGSRDGDLPMYLLLYGGPDALPWELQYQLNANRRVGRLHLTGDALANYVTALLGNWSDSAARYDSPVVWAVDHGGDDITHLMRTAVAAGIATRIAADTDMPGGIFLDGSAATATHAQLLDALVDNSPALVATTSHGMTGPLGGGHEEELAANLGLLVDGLHATLDVEELLRRWKPDGAIWYAHACCSAGTSTRTGLLDLFPDDSRVARVLRGVGVVGPAVAPLPTALLGASRPARAFVGHVEPTFDWTLSSPFTGQPLTDSIVTAVYDRLCLGKPVGLAFDEPFRHIGELAAAHENAVGVFNQSLSPGSVTAAVYTKLAWLDRQSTVILGDPTVAIPLPTA